ncbi:hypothetical protein [Streptomyces sp. NPDC056949]
MSSTGAVRPRWSPTAGPAPAAEGILVLDHVRIAERDVRAGRPGRRTAP